MKALFEVRKVIFLAALFSGIVTGGAAHAATLVSPFLVARSGIDFVACVIVNASTKDITATVEVMNFAGVVLKQGTLSVPPGNVNDVSLGSITGGYCRFSGKFTAKKVRASVNVIASAGLETTAVARAE